MKNDKYTKKQVDALLTFLEPINEYDREESIAIVCADLNIESRTSIRKLLDDRYFLDQWYARTALSVKYELSSVLFDAIKDREFDFEWLTHDADGTFCLPVCFGEGRSRMLYEEIYRAVFDHWREELKILDLNLINPSDLGIPSFE